MRKNLVLFFLICLHYLQVSAQKLVAISPRVNFLSVLDPIYPTIQPGIEIKRNNFSLVYLHGIKADLIFRKDRPTSPYYLQKNKLAFRYYKDFIVHRLWHQEFYHYWSLQLFRNVFGASYKNGVFIDGAGNLQQYDFANNRKIIQGFGIAAGNIFYFLKGKFSVDWSAGAGARWVNNLYYDVENLRPGGRPPTISNQAGKRVTPHIFNELSLVYNMNQAKATNGKKPNKF